MVQKLHKAIYTMMLLCISSLITCTLFTSPTAAAASLSYVRFIHAATGLGPVDIYVDGTKAGASVPFATLSAYNTLPSGPHLIQVAPAGQGINASIVKQVLTFASDTPYTVAAVGTSTSNAGLVLYAENNIITQPGLIKVRIYHLSPDAGPVNIVTSSGQPVAGNLTYQSATSYLTIPPGAYTFTVNLSNGKNLTFSNNLTSSNTVYYLFAVGLVNGSPKAEGVSSLVTGVPGTPNTGSDPNPLPITRGMPFNWSLLALVISVLALIAVGVSRGQYRAFLPFTRKGTSSTEKK